MGRDLIHGENSAIHPVKSRRGKKCWATVGSVGRSPGNDKNEEPARGLINIARFLSSPLFSFLSSFSFSPFRRVGQRLHKSPCFYQSTRFERTFARDLIFYSPSHPRERITRDEGSCPIPLMNKLDRFVSKASRCCKFMYTFFLFPSFDIGYPASRGS